MYTPAAQLATYSVSDYVSWMDIYTYCADLYVRVVDPTPIFGVIQWLATGMSVYLHSAINIARTYVDSLRRWWQNNV